MADVRIDQAARLAREWADLGSIELVVSKEVSPFPGIPEAKDQLGWVRSHYIETPTRCRFLEMTMKDRAGRPNGHHLACSDGQRNSAVRYRADDLDVPELMIQGASFDEEALAGGSTRPIPLCYYYIDKTPLHEALPTSTYLGSEPIAGQPHHVFLFENLMWGKIRQDLVLHLAGDQILPTRLTFYKTGTDRLVGKPLWSWMATAVEVIQGRKFPVKSQLVDYLTDDPIHQGEWVSKMTIESVSFGKSYPAATFRRDVDDRAMVFDHVKDKVIFPKVQPITPQAAVINPIRVEPVTDNSNAMMMSGVILGLATIGTGTALWLRRSRR